jgi:hypothetical protein
VTVKTIGHSAKQSGRGPIIGRIALFWKGSREDRLDEANFRPKANLPEFNFEQN